MLRWFMRQMGRKLHGQVPHGGGGDYGLGGLRIGVEQVVGAKMRPAGPQLAGNTQLVAYR